MPNNDIVYLLKFAPKEAYIDDPINGRLFMNAASYHHGLSGEQGDPLEASMAPPRHVSTEITACHHGHALVEKVAEGLPAAPTKILIPLRGDSSSTGTIFAGTVHAPFVNALLHIR